MLKPLRGRIIAERIEKEKISDGGIVFIDNQKEEVKAGKVISVGGVFENKAGKKFYPPCKAGDTIYFKAKVHKRFQWQDKLLIWFEDVVGVEEK